MGQSWQNLKVAYGLSAQKVVDKEIAVLNSSGWVFWLQERTVAMIVAEMSCSTFLILNFFFQCLSLV